jgi:hypothetical protein
MNRKTLREELAQSKASKRSSLRRRDGNQHFELEDHLWDAFNKGTTPEGDVITSIGQDHAQLSPISKRVKYMIADARTQSG